MKWKTAVIWMLVGLNSLLLLGVVLNFAIQPAYAQFAGRSGFMLIPARYQTNDEALWIIDQGGKKIAVYVLDARGNLSRADARSLEKDFRRGGR